MMVVVFILAVLESCQIYRNAPHCVILLFIYHFDTSDQRESVLDISHIARLSVQYKKYHTLILDKTFQDIITSLMMHHISLMMLRNTVQA